MSKKFTDLTTKTTAAAADWVPINDVSASTDKKTSVGGLAAGVASNFADGAVQANALSASAITLGYAQITANFTTSSTSTVPVTGLSATVTIPSGGRRVRVSMYVAQAFNSTAQNNIVISLWDGAAGSGTQLSYGIHQPQLANVPVFFSVTTVVTPAAGSKTYSVGVATTGSNTTTLAAATIAPAYILVEAI